MFLLTFYFFLLTFCLVSVYFLFTFCLLSIYFSVYFLSICQQGFGNGRCSWDPVVTLRAIRSDSSSYATEAGEGDGRVNVDYWGTNTWQDGDISGHKWLVLNGAWDNNWGLVDDTRRGLEDLLDDLLCDAPPIEDGKTIST